MKKYRISINMNRITVPYEEDFEKARLYHGKHGINFNFIFKEVDVRGYKSVFNKYLNRYLIQGADNLIELDSTVDVNMFVFDMNEWANPKGSKYPLNKETPNGSCMLVGNKPFICIGTYKTDHDSGQTWIQIAHEIMHSYVQNARLKGFDIEDVMDTYRLNSDPDNPLSNFSEQWKLLYPYFAQN